MKLHILLPFLITSLLSYGQKIDPNYILPDSGKHFISVYLNIYDLKMSKAKSLFDDIDNLKSNEFKELKNGYTYFTFKKTYMSVWYNTSNQSLIGDLKSINIIDNNIFVGMVEENGSFLTIEISINENGSTNAILKETNRRGKVKVYFSENCELNRYSA